MTRRSTKQDLILLILTVLIEFCYLTASLTLREHAPPRITLISASSIDQQQQFLEPHVDYQQGLENAELLDNGSPAASNEDHDHIVNGENPTSGDTGITGTHANIHDDSNIVAVDASGVSGGQDTRPHDTLPATGGPHSSSDDDTKIDQNHPSTGPPPLLSSAWTFRWPWSHRSTISYEDTADTGVTNGTGRNDNNGQTNSGISGHDDDNRRAEEVSTEAPDSGITEPPNSLEEEEQVEEEDRDRWECILGASDVYLAWWINNDGSLRKSPTPEYENDNGATSGE